MVFREGGSIACLYYLFFTEQGDRRVGGRQPRHMKMRKSTSPNSKLYIYVSTVR